MKFISKLFVALVAGLLATQSANAQSDFTIVVDYTYDTNNFFDTQLKRDALEAAASRFSTIIDSTLTAVGPAGNGVTQPDWRVGFSHPGTGAGWQLSTAANSGSDSINGAGGGTADEYGFGGLNANEWILFAGGRSLGGPAGVGGTGTGTNFLTTFNDLDGPMHRGVISNTPSATTADLPAWGGSISFEQSLNWHYELDTAATGSEVDFYSIALHEIGHALGLSAGWNQWTVNQSGVQYSGSEALAAYNEDNGTSATFLNTASSSNFHWEDGTYDSKIFEAGNPQYAGTVGQGNLQDLLMEPVANFSASVRRLELTNVDVAALRDIGWSTISGIPEPTSAIVLVGYGLMIVTRRRRKS